MAKTTTDDLLDDLIRWPGSQTVFFYMTGYRELYEKARARGYVLRLEPDPDDPDVVTAWVEPRTAPDGPGGPLG